jgi:hypothetical protein
MRRKRHAKHAIAIMAAIVMGGLPISIAVAADHHHHVRQGACLREADPVVGGGWIMNGNFDWHRCGKPVPWYGRGYSDSRVARTQTIITFAIPMADTEDRDASALQACAGFRLNWGSEK